MALKRPAESGADPFSPANFSWRVNAAGYQWKWSPTTLTGPNRPTGFSDNDEHYVLEEIEGVGYREYYPLKEAALYRTFSQASSGDMLSFANKYGPLGLSCGPLGLSPYGPSLDAIDVRGKFDGPDSVEGESRSNWLTEIQSLNAAIQVLAALKGDNERALRKWVTRWGELRPSARMGLELEKDQHPSKDDWVAIMRDEHGKPVTVHQLWTTGKSRRTIAWDHLVAAVNRRIYLQCLPYLRQRGESIGNLSIRLIPSSLLGALWWQFARVVTGELDYRPCRVCHRLIELSTGEKGFRHDREFCSNKCKFKDHRRKVREAKQLRAGGQTVRQIAKHFETTTTVIKNWLTKKK
jgi:hypothetical protein